MLINEVESVVGLSKKSIRYYEEAGLLSPKRSKGNGYRDYTDEDIVILKKIKFLRELDISVQDIKKLKEGQISLNACMQDRINKIKAYENNYQKIMVMCKEIYESDQDYGSLDVEDYAKEMQIINKEGFSMRTVSDEAQKKISGAIISSIVFMLFFGFLCGMITYFQMTEEEKMPMILYIFFMGVFIVPMISVVFNLITRIKEINGGEEDEASKY